MLSKNIFRNIIIDRGIDYYNRDLVSGIINDNGIIYAKVNSYNVHIGQNICRCSCPCYVYRENCKHIYALLLKIQDIDQFRNIACEIINHIGEKITDLNNSTEILHLGTELLDIIIENEIYMEPELAEKICSYEHILKQIDSTDIFGSIVDRLMFIPDYNM